MSFLHSHILPSPVRRNPDGSHLWGVWADLDSAQADRAAPLNRSDAGFGRPALCVARSNALGGACSWLTARGIGMSRIDSLGGMLPQLRARPRQWSMLLLALDDLGGITEVIEDLLALRRQVPDLPVVIFSTNVQCDDLSTGRLVLCDATLRAPTSAARFGFALAEATVNNRVWVDRSARLGNPAPTKGHLP